MKVKRQKKSVKAMRLPEVAAKAMERNYYRSGVVTGDTLLSTAAKQVTVEPIKS